MNTITPELVRSWLNELDSFARRGLLSRIKRIGEAYLALAEQREWKNIDSAPKDGTVVDLYMPDTPFGRRVDCYYTDITNRIFLGNKNNPKYGWVCQRDGLLCGDSATHFMPKPQPPGGAE